MTGLTMLARNFLMSLILFVFSGITLAPGMALAQNAAESIDDRINQFLAPLTQAANDIVFAGFDIAGVSVPILVIWLGAAALFFTPYMGFVNFRSFKQAIRIVRGTYDNPADPGEVTHFQALSAALSNTVGLGNITGVAVAITLGGPGATFWMILAGLFGMTTKFVECTLGHKYRVIDENGVVSGGPMYYMSRGLKEHGYGRLGRVLAVMAAMFAVAGTFGSGAMFQSNQSTQQLLNVLSDLTGQNLDGSQWIFGTIIAAFVGVVIIGGIKRIAGVASVLVPAMAIFYLATATIIVAINYDAIPAAFSAIFTGAFTAPGIAGGAVGVFIQGMRRATFSNEAGLGYAAIAHAAAKTNEPVAEGLVALLEPFIDTVVICTMTALVIIITGMHVNSGSLSGIALTSAAFASVFSWFPYLLSVAAVLFAYSTMIATFYFGQRAFFYLVKQPTKTTDLVFKLTFLAAIVAGSGLSLDAAVGFADATYMAIAFPNLIALYILAPDVKKMLNSYLKRVKSGEIKPYEADKAT
jgi:alanine or glycine:cation symporter, AGCS family